ncbi:MAG: YraN family protein [Coprococcus sp.]
MNFWKSKDIGYWSIISSRRYAEIDIVAKDGEYLVFCEVKFRKTGGLSAALEAVSVPKQMRLSGADRLLSDEERSHRDTMPLRCNRNRGE